MYFTCLKGRITETGGGTDRNCASAGTFLNGCNGQGCDRPKPGA